MDKSNIAECIKVWEEVERRVESKIQEILVISNQLCNKLSKLISYSNSEERSYLDKIRYRVGYFREYFENYNIFRLNDEILEFTVKEEYHELSMVSFTFQRNIKSDYANVATIIKHIENSLRRQYENTFDFKKGLLSIDTSDLYGLLEELISELKNPLETGLTI